MGDRWGRESKKVMEKDETCGAWERVVCSLMPGWAGRCFSPPEGVKGKVRKIAGRVGG